MARMTARMALTRARKSAVSAHSDAMRYLLKVLKVKCTILRAPRPCVPLAELEVNGQKLNNLNETTNKAAGISDDWSGH